MYSELCKTSAMKCFAKIVNSLAVNYFHETLHRGCLWKSWILLRPCLKPTMVEAPSSTFVSYKRKVYAPNNRTHSLPNTHSWRFHTYSLGLIFYYPILAYWRFFQMNLPAYIHWLAWHKNNINNTAVASLLLYLQLLLPSHGKKEVWMKAALGLNYFNINIKNITFFHAIYDPHKKYA